MNGKNPFKNQPKNQRIIKKSKSHLLNTQLVYIFQAISKIIKVILHDQNHPAHQSHPGLQYLSHF